MARFLLPKADSRYLYDDRDLLILARCTMLAKEWMENESQYADLHRRYSRELRDALSERFPKSALLARWDFQNPANCVFHVEPHDATGSNIPLAVEKHARENFFAPEDFEALIVAAAKRSDSMTSVLALLRDPSPRTDLIPYLGDTAIYEQVLKVAAQDKIALNRDGTWYGREPGQSFEDALRVLKQRAMPTGWEWGSIQLGLPSEVSGGGVAVTPRQTGTTGTLFGGGVAAPQPPPTTMPAMPATPPIVTPLQPPTSTGAAGSAGVSESDGTQPAAGTASPQPVIRKSLGAKSGLNLLGDLEKWALPDGQRVTQATLTFNGLSVKELRDLCTRLPQKLLAELLITMPPDGEKPA